MKSNLLVLIVILTFLFTTAIALAELLPEKIQLEEGENEVLMPIDFSPIYVKDFVRVYPEIQTITYLEQKNYGLEEIEVEIGYVNAFGGIGENFIMQEGVIYFMTVQKNLEVLIK